MNFVCPFYCSQLPLQSSLHRNSGLPFAPGKVFPAVCRRVQMTQAADQSSQSSHLPRALGDGEYATCPLFSASQLCGVLGKAAQLVFAWEILPKRLVGLL